MLDEARRSLVNFMGCAVGGAGDEALDIAIRVERLIEFCWKLEDLSDVNEVVQAAVAACARSGSYAVTA